MKYAIYQTEVGLDFVNYVDTKEGLKHYPYIREDSLPVIINRVGGYTSFKEEYEKEDGFLEIVEFNDEGYPLTREQMYPKNSPKFEYGWIDLDGNTYNTGYEEHSRSARFICEEFGFDSYRPENILEDKGWIKVTASQERGYLKKKIYAYHDGNYFITKKQYDTLFELDLHDVEDAPHLIRVSEKRW